MIRLKNGSRPGGFTWDHPSVSPFFGLFKPTSWGTGRWKGWGLGRAEPGKKTEEQSPSTGHCFPQPREKVENGCFYDYGNCFSLP
jgi:hypothetical protein